MSMRKLVVAVAAGVVTAPMLSGCVINLGGNETPAQTTPAPITTDAPQTQDSGELDAQTAALEAYVEANRAEVEALVNDPAYSDTYSVITIEAFAPDTVQYIYVYKEPVDMDVAVANFDSNFDTFNNAARDQLIPDMIANGIAIGPKVSWVYFQPDLTLIWTGTFDGS